MPIEDMGIRGATSRAGETPALPAECSDGACLTATSRVGRMPALPAECADRACLTATFRAGETPALPAECSDGACLTATSRVGRMPALPVAECGHDSFGGPAWANDCFSTFPARCAKPMATRDFP